MSKNRRHMLRRSAVSVVEYCDIVGFTPGSIVMVGVGVRHDDADHLTERWPNAVCVGFEPCADAYLGIRDTFPGLLRRLAIDAYSGGHVELYTRRNWKNGSSVFSENFGEDGPSDKELVPRSTLDDALKDVVLGTDALVWLDCEGAELNAVLGGEQTLSCAKLVNVEMTCRPRDERVPKPQNIHAVLRDLGFRQAWVHTTRPCIGQFDAIYVPQSELRASHCCCIDSLESR